MAYSASVSRFPDGRPAEIFLSCSKPSSETEDLARDSAILVSLALQHGAPVEILRNALSRDTSGEPCGPIGRVLDLLAAASPDKENP